ncbi:MAG: hypothetical protein ABEK50_00915, partial [bacterium]
IGTHRHQYEVTDHLPDSHCDVTLIPHVIPAERGIESAIYTAPSRDPGFLEETLAEFSHEHEGLRWRDAPPGLQAVARTSYADLSSYREDGVFIVFTGIDNLRKGAASQAIQNANVMCGLPVNRGLLPGV